MIQRVNPLQTCNDQRTPSMSDQFGASTQDVTGVPASQRHLLQLTGLLLLFTLLYALTFRSLVELWWTEDDYSYGFLVPIVSLYLAFLRREALRHLSLRPAQQLGLLVMSIAALLLVIGETGAVIALSQTSLLVMIVGLMLSLAGTQFLSVLRLPVGYLFFMLPLFGQAILSLRWPLQLLTARMAVLILQMLSIPAQLNENYVVLPNIILRVASSCSGARYLVSIIAVSIPVAYLTLRRRRNQIAFIALALAIGVFANWARVVFIGLWAYSGGQVVHGPFHVFQAVSVAWVSYAGLFLAAWTLRKIERPSQLPVTTAAEVPPLVPGPLFPPDWISAWKNSLVMLSTLLLLLTVCRAKPTSPKQDLSSFPTVIGEWVESAQERPTTIFRAKGADQEIHKLYKRAGGRPLCLYMAYYEQQTHAKEVGDDFITELIESAEAEVKLVGGEGRVLVPVNHAIFGDGSQILFWYDFNGRTAATRVGAKAYTIWNTLTRGRSNGALVMVYCERERNITQESDSEEMKNFMVELLPVLRRYLP